jgi:hypothetical protein
MAGLEGVPPQTRKKLKEAVRKLRQQKAAQRAKAAADARAKAGKRDSAAIQEKRHVERHPDVNVRRGS